MHFLKLILRNTLRHKLRTGLTVLGIVVAIIAFGLLRTVVESEDGLGVGLFQVARWAEQSGYRLLLQENQQGSVCFELVEASRK